MKLHFSGGQRGSGGHQRLGRVHLDREARPRFEPGQPEDAVALVHRGTRLRGPFGELFAKRGAAVPATGTTSSAPKGAPYVASMPEMTATRRQSSAAAMTLMG